MTNDIATKRLRIQRLIGLDDTKGVRGDLARTRAAADRGDRTANGKQIGEEIARLEAALTTYGSMLDGLEVAS